MDGVIVVDKPEGWTSHDAVNKVRRLAGTRKVGHLGTLDPLATGVLPLVVGRATRLAQFLMRGDKTYDAVVRFGYATDTYDRDGTPVSPVTEPELDRARLEAVLDQFRGRITQMPPPISAKKVGGTPAYRLVRRNIPVELKPVEVTVHSIELLEIQGPEARLLVRCSQGTYMRSIAHDLGQALGCGAFLKSLRRLASGDFRIEQARTIPELEELARQGRLAEALIPAAQLLPEFPSEMVDSLTARQIRQGRDFRVSPFRARTGARYVKAVTPDGQLVAIGEQKLPNLYHPCVVL
ncbi:MAG TPA: tRNA pseudouridine(55) synthase TruB [Bryobacteraceae bacterium]|nr:tRNA pseudouridine(55) synthase TruB [Bryobacteraceae bacterium]